MSNTVASRKYHIDFQSPDGGYSYVIMMGMVLLLVCAWGNQGTFAFIFNDILKESGRQSSALELITGSYSSALSFACLFSSSLFKRYSMRFVGIIGSIIFFTSSLLIVGVNSVEQLLLFYGILQAVGYGMMVPVAYTSFNAYFVKKRDLMMNITKSIIGFTLMFYPMFVQFLLNQYCFQAALLIIAALHTHVILAMISMHPIEMHYKVIKTPIEQSDDPSCSHEESGEPIQREEIELNDSTSTENSSSSNDGRNLIKSYVDRREHFQRDKSELNESMLNEEPSCSHHQGNLVNTPEQQQIGGDIPGPSENRIMRILNKYLDLSFLIDPIYVNIVLGITFVLISDSSFSHLQPMYLLEMGFSKDDTAKLLSIRSAADLISRLFLSILCVCTKIKARYIFLSGAISTVFVRLVFLSIVDFNGMAMITAASGFFHAWLNSPVPLIFADLLPQERFASGYSLYLFMEGQLTFLIGPFIGYIRDATDSYVICFHSLTIILCFCIVQWISEIFWFIIYPRENPN